jgi:arylformamidase
MAIDPLVEAHYVFSPGHPSRTAVYREIAGASAAARRSDRVLLNLPYGDHERQRLDLFPGRDGHPLVIFFHGGYWRSQDKDAYSFVATALRQDGCSVAVAGYPLAPQWSLARIVGSCRTALQWLRGPGRKLLPQTAGLVVAGHSAGAQLAASLASDDEAGAGVIGCVALSGIFDLRPLVHTSIGESIGLDEAAAAECSPIERPPGPGWLIAAVGSEESDGFRAQTRQYTAHWAGAQRTAAMIEVQGADHYSILRELANPDGVVLKALRARLHAACELPA